MQIGLVGMPASGKTTLFNLLTASEYSTGIGGTDEVHVGSAVVHDHRVDYLKSLYKPKKTTSARIDFKDIPGVKMEDSRARASRLLDEVRSSDALVQVVRAFNNAEVNSLSGNCEPYREITDYSAELILADIDSLEKRIDRLESGSKKQKDDSRQLALLNKLLRTLENEESTGNCKLTEEEKELLAGQQLLSEKPLFLVINIDEEQMRSGNYPDKERIIAYAEDKKLPVIEVCALLEMEINRLQPDERSEFLDDLGLKESGLDLLSQITYKSLNLSSFFTVGEDEVRAWRIKKGTAARKAAGKIHSDIERGFIRAEVFHYDSLEKLGSVAKVREAGQFRLEGKEYEVLDGDIISFRFNV